MTNRLELNWKLDGFVDEQRYYCSETPIDVNNLPTPKAILAGDVRTYTDTAIELGKTYHAVVGSIKNSVQKLSNVQSIIASARSFRYMRVYITANNGLDSYSEFQQIEFALQPEGVDITTAATPAYQSSYYPDRPARNLVSNAFDGANYIWTSATGVSGPHWVAFDLLFPQDVVEVRIYPTNLHPWQGRAPKDFIIQGSEDNVTWVDIKGFYGVSGWVPGGGKVFSLN